MDTVKSPVQAANNRISVQIVLYAEHSVKKDLGKLAITILNLRKVR